MSQSAAGVAATGPLLVARATGQEFDRAMAACNFALAVWRAPFGVIRIVNRPLEELLGRPADQIIGRRLDELWEPREAARAAVGALGSGAVEAVRARREVVRPSGTVVPVWVWARAVEFDEARGGVSLFVPVATAACVGRDPDLPWRELANIGVGAAERATWRIVQVSADVSRISGLTTNELIGTSLFSLLHLEPMPDDPALVDVPTRGSLVHPDGSVVDVGLLYSTYEPPDGAPALAVFAIIVRPGPDPNALANRVDELERRLRYIGAEVRAAGVLDEISHLPSPNDHPALAELTSRQWEILSRLLRGERVPTIAAALFLSQSTVRNHLTAIFRRFEVHSQSELLSVPRTRYSS